MELVATHDDADIEIIPPLSMRQIRAILVERFPKAFMGKGVQKIPLAIGIHRGISHRVPDVRKKQLASALFNYCSGPSYLRELSAGSARFDLNGEYSGIVSQQDQDEAERRLARMGFSFHKLQAPDLQPRECRLSDMRIAA